MRTVLVLNGPNLARLGSREPDVYGQASLDELQQACAATAAELGLAVDFRQTDDESEIIAWVHEAADRQLPIVLNPAAFTHYSYALRDASRCEPRHWSRFTSPTRPRGRRSGTTRWSLR